MRVATMILLLGCGLTSAQDDTKIKRGVEAPPAQANQPPAPAISPLAEKVYAVPSLVVAGISAVLIVGAICLPIKQFAGEE